jgi:hypothetical protein
MSMRPNLSQMFGRARVALIAVVVLASGLGVHAAGAQSTPGAPGPAAITAPPPPPQKYVCGDEGSGKLCQCTGAADCVDMKNGGQCTDAIVNFSKNMGQCTWKGPPSQNPTATTMRPTRGPSTVAPASHAQFYGCKYKGDQVVGCSCKDVQDCLKLDDTKLCGNSPIVDVDPNKGSGKCGAF